MRLRYRDVIFFSRRIERDRVDTTKARLINEAFNAWLLGASDKKTFESFINALNLGEKVEKLDPEKRAKMIERSNANAERILKQARIASRAKRKKQDAKKNI